MEARALTRRQTKKPKQLNQSLKCLLTSVWYTSVFTLWFPKN